MQVMWCISFDKEMGAFKKMTLREKIKYLPAIMLSGFFFFFGIEGVFGFQRGYMLKIENDVLFLQNFVLGIGCFYFAFMFLFLCYEKKPKYIQLTLE